MPEKTININELKNNMLLNEEQFVIETLESKQSKQGKEYLNIVLKDKTGDLNGKVWTEQIPNIDKEIVIGDIVAVTGTIQIFNEKPQIVINKMTKAENMDLSLFMKNTPRDVEQMIEFMSSKIDQIDDNQIKQLCTLLWTGSLKDALVHYPAGMYVHHGYVSGLLEHYFEMIVLSETMCNLFPEMNPDILLAGILFHDIGKLEEYAYQGASIITTKEGQLIGHITQGTLLLEEYCRKIDNFSDDIKNQIMHIVLSHHGELQYGSPVLPKTVEAIAVCNLDAMSSKIHIALEHIERDTNDDNEFTEFNRWMGVSILKTNRLKS